jgi:hypothetical protein
LQSSRSKLLKRKIIVTIIQRKTDRLILNINEIINSINQLYNNSIEYSDILFSKSLINSDSNIHYFEDLQFKDQVNLMTNTDILITGRVSAFYIYSIILFHFINELYYSY